MQVNIWFNTLVAFLRLSTFRKCESLRAEKLVEQENGHRKNAIYYRESMGTDVVLCTLKGALEIQGFTVN